MTTLVALITTEYFYYILLFLALILSVITALLSRVKKTVKPVYILYPTILFNLILLTPFFLPKYQFEHYYYEDTNRLEEIRLTNSAGITNSPAKLYYQYLSNKFETACVYKPLAWTNHNVLIYERDCPRDGGLLSRLFLYNLDTYQKITLPQHKYVAYSDSLDTLYLSKNSILLNKQNSPIYKYNFNNNKLEVTNITLEKLQSDIANEIYPETSYHNLMLTDTAYNINEEYQNTFMAAYPIISPDNKYIAVTKSYSNDIEELIQVTRLNDIFIIKKPQLDSLY